MHYFICPSSRFRVTLIHVGDENIRVTVDNLEAIRNHIDVDKNRVFNINEWCAIPAKVEIIPESPPDKEYVYYCTSEEDYFNPTEDDIKHYQEVFKEGLNDENFIIFTYYDLIIKRISKSLLPFL